MLNIFLCTYSYCSSSILFKYLFIPFSYFLIGFFQCCQVEVGLHWPQKWGGLLVIALHMIPTDRVGRKGLTTWQQEQKFQTHPWPPQYHPGGIWSTWLPPYEYDLGSLLSLCWLKWGWGHSFFLWCLAEWKHLLSKIVSLERLPLS